MICPEKSGLLHENFLLLERCPEKCFQFVERNDIGTVVQVRMVCSGNAHQFLVVALQLFERVFAEIAGMGLFSMNEKYGAADFVDVSQNRHVHERKRRCPVPSVVGIE